MPTLTRWFVKTSLVYFILALTTGLWLGEGGLRGMAAPFNGLFPVYFHLLAEGWLTLLIIGVAGWMFPTYSRTHPRGSDTLAWASYILLNLGLLLRVVSEPIFTLDNVPGSTWGVLLALAALLQWLGGLAFAANTWARVKAK